MANTQDHTMPGAGRVTIRETPDGLGIYVPAERNWPLIGFLLLWLAGWALGETLAIADIVTSGNLVSNAFLIVWVSLWTVGGGLALAVLVWQFFGTERLFITGGALVHAAGIGFVRRQAVHALGDLGPPRIGVIGEARKYSTPRKGEGPVKAIIFEAGDRSVRFGAGMNDEERSLALAAILRHMPAAPDAAEPET